jgi:hypothetical protein
MTGHWPYLGPWFALGYDLRELGRAGKGMRRHRPLKRCNDPGSLITGVQLYLAQEPRNALKAAYIPALNKATGDRCRHGLRIWNGGKGSDDQGMRPSRMAQRARDVSTDVRDQQCNWVSKRRREVYVRAYIATLRNEEPQIQDQQ